MKKPDKICPDCNEFAGLGAKPTKDGITRCVECSKKFRAEKAKQKTFDRIQDDPDANKCPFCDVKFSRMRYGIAHLKKDHPDKTEKEFRYWIYTGQGDPILCACGCGIEIDVEKFVSNPHEPKYIWGHASKVHNNWGHNQIARENSNKTRCERLKSGEIQVWSKGKSIETCEILQRAAEKLKKENNPERAKKISESCKNNPKVLAHLKNLAKQGKGCVSKLERQIFVSLLESVGLSYLNDRKKKGTFSWSYLLHFERNKYKVYDFYLNGTNIFIEINGDYWHSNPKKYPQPINENQVRNMKNDKFKYKLADDNGFKVLYLWEDDIRRKTEDLYLFFDRLKEELKNKYHIEIDNLRNKNFKIKNSKVIFIF